MQIGSGPRWRDPVLWLALAAAAPLRFLGLGGPGGPSLWLDEALSARTAALSPAGILAAAASDLHPPGYYLVLHWWTAPFQPNAAGFPGEWALRSLSAAASIALVPLAFWLGHAWAADVARRAACARAAACIAALSPYAISLAREARMYALLSLLLAVQFALWTRLREGRGGPAAWGGVALVGAAAMYVHYHALLFTAALCVASWIGGPGAARRFGRRFALAAAASFLAFAPWLPRVAEQAAHGVRDWLPFSHSPFILARTLAAFVRGDGASADELSLWMVPVVFLLWRGMRRGGGGPGLVLLLPLGIAYAASFAVNLFGARYFGGPAVVAWVLAARGATAIEPRRTSRWATAAAGLALLAFGVGIARRSDEAAGRGEAWRELVQAVEEASPRGTAVLFPFAEPLAPFVYYSRPGHLTLVGGIARGADGRAALAPGFMQALDDGLDAPELVWWVPYQEGLYDSGRLGRGALSDRGLGEAPTPIRIGRLVAIPFHLNGERL
jgi:hypothetical protein